MFRVTVENKYSQSVPLLKEDKPVKSKGNGKFHSITGQDSPEG